MIFDVGSILVNLFKWWQEDKEARARWQLRASAGWSGFLGLCGGWGGALIAGKAPWLSFGWGLMVCSGAVLGVLLRSPQARSLLLSVPQTVVKEYQDPTGNTIIEPKK